VPVGLLLGYSKAIYESMEVVVDFFRSIPVFCLFPLFLVFFGIGDTAKICTAAWSSSFIILVNTMYGVRNSTKTRRMVAQTMGATKVQILCEVIVPDALPDIVVGMRNGLSLALIVVVVTEMFMGTRFGLGREIFDASMVYQIPRMYAAILVTGLLGYALNKIFVLIERRVVHWAGK
jgi:NitT/TauT family transport system permease protein